MTTETASQRRTRTWPMITDVGIEHPFNGNEFIVWRVSIDEVSNATGTHWAPVKGTRTEEPVLRLDRRQLAQLAASAVSWLGGTPEPEE
jgi:hypothetical protein